MREIRFRGKAIMSIEKLELMGIEHDNGWVYGNLIIKNDNRPIITVDPEWWVVVDPKSVSQYVGLKDKNGNDVYEGDIVKTDIGNGVVVFDSGAFLVRNLDDDEYYGFDDFFSLYEGGCYLVEVIGNIYENPELLKGENNE